MAAHPDSPSISNRALAARAAGVVLFALLVVFVPMLTRAASGSVGYGGGFVELYLASPEIAASGVRPGDVIDVVVVNRFDSAQTFHLLAGGVRHSQLRLQPGDAVTVSVVAGGDLRVGEDVVVGLEELDDSLRVKVR